MYARSRIVLRINIQLNADANIWLEHHDDHLSPIVSSWKWN